MFIRSLFDLLATVTHCFKLFFSFWQILKIAHENHTQHFTKNNYNIYVYNDKVIFISIG